MRNRHHDLILCAIALALASLLALGSPQAAQAAGVVTDCSSFGPGPGTLAAALETDGLITFACSGVIVLPDQIAMYINRHLVIDGSGQAVTLSGGNRTRLFNLGPGSSLHLHNLTLTAGNADGGGAIQSAGALTITNSALLSNTADYGGALELTNGSVLIQNSTLADNWSSGTDSVRSGGGAINQYFDPTSGGASSTEPSVEIVNSTITNNRSAVGGRAGIWQENGRLRIYYSIVAGNSGGNCQIAPPNPQQFATAASLDDDGTCQAAQRANPQLGPLRTRRDGPPIFPLLPGSPAIDAAPAAACTGAADGRGLLRPQDGSQSGAAACDLGAYEVAGRRLVAAAAADGLAGYWKFDEGGGATVMDSSGHGLTGTLFGGAGFAADHPSLLFNTPFALQSSPTAGLQVADAAPLNPTAELSVAGWVRLNSLAGVQSLAAKLGGSSGPGYGLLIRDGQLAAEAWDSTGVRHVITGEVTAGSWLHIAMTYRQGGEMAVYVNGRKTGAQTVTAALGGSNASLLLAADGLFDDVRVYDRALTPGAVAALAAGRPCVTTGASWAAALPDLQCALIDAEAGAEVWVGPGIYRPTYGPDRTATFTIGDGVGVYGGFAGNENGRAERTPQTPLPVLSGDIEANDPLDASGLLTDPAAVVGGNAFHVVTINSTLTTTVLERVTISGGQATAAGMDGDGGGLWLAGGAPQLSGLRLIGNQAAGRGGAIFAEQSSAVVISATLQANRAVEGGGGFWRGAAPLVANSLIAGNQAAGNGGGMCTQDSSLRLVNVTVAANQAGGSGGGLWLGGGTASAANLVAGANAAGGDAQLGGSGSIQTSLVQGGCAAGINCAADVLVGDPLFVAAAPAGAPGGLGDYRLRPASPAIDSGDNNAALAAGAPGGATAAALLADLAGGPRLLAARRQPAQIDQGAYEAAHTPPLFLTEPVTEGATTVEYVYEAIAIDPNALDAPATRLPIEVTKKPEWLRLDMQADGSALLHGAPPVGWYGYFNVTLRSTDSFGAATEQKFMIHIVERAYSLYLPQVRR